MCSANAEGLLQRAGQGQLIDKVNRARLLASVAPGSGFWLNACRVLILVFALATRSFGSPSAWASEHPSCGPTVECGERPHSSSSGWTSRFSGATRQLWWEHWLRAMSYGTNLGNSVRILNFVSCSNSADLIFCVSAVCY